MKLDIVIPSRNRLKKLYDCIDSIREAVKEIPEVECTIHIFVDFGESLFDVVSDMDIFIVHTLEEEYRAPLFWNKYLKTMEADVLCYLNDDIKLDKYCLKEALSFLKGLDYDGVIGLNQSNQTGTTNCSAAFGMIGSKFADRFPNREVFCPDYYCLYLDEELMKYAQSLNKFIFCNSAKLEHYHPSFTKEKPDDTHIHNRRHKQIDIEIYNLRKEKNLLWGESFEKIEHGESNNSSSRNFS